MNKSTKLISSIASFRTYSKFLSHLGRRESLAETINRNMTMHLDRFPNLSRDIVKAYQKVHELKVMPSMRALQFSGEAILKNNTRMYNCSFVNMTDTRAFGEILYLLLSGVGVGYSVQNRHISQLPKIKKPIEEGYFVIQDSIAGWAQALDILLEAYFYGRVRPQFDFGNIRSKGSYLVTTGAKAPGPEPLKKMLEQVENKIKNSLGKRLTSLEVHDLNCIISDAVLAGGIRRAALISLFDRDDNEMLTCKSGNWWDHAPWRARSNNSVVLPRNEITKDEFDNIIKATKESQSGEPGFLFTNDLDHGTNPSLRGGTRVWTKEFGMVPIEELENKSFTVKGLNGTLCSAKCWMSSPSEILYRIRLNGGVEYYATKEHKWAVLSGSGEYVKLRTDEIKPGMKFPRLTEQDLVSYKTNGTYEEGKIIGYFYGDGWITDRSDNGKRQYGVVVPNNVERKADYLQIFSDLFESNGCIRNHGVEFNSTSKRIDEFFKTFGVDKKEKGLPEFIFREASNQFINGFIQGYFDADGHTSIEKNSRQSICSKDEKLINDFYELLGFKGRYYTKTYSVRESYVGANKKTYNKINHRYTLRKRAGVIGKETEVEVLSVEKTTLVEPVWDISVNDKDHAFQLAHCITGNCGEIALNSNQFCNLTTINQTGITSEKDFLNRVYSATLIGTLQASYTDFNYIRPEWTKTTEREALLGVSFTGIADSYGIVTSEMLQKGAQLVKEVNEKYAKKLGINIAARTTTVKPEGTSSVVLGSSSGIHARHSEYYIRRIRMNKDDALAVYLKNVIPDLVEDDLFSSTGIVVSIPQHSPDGAVLRQNETALDQLNRALFYNKNWIEFGHRTGVNKHNVSLTISVKDDEWDSLREAMWENRNYYSGISLLPYDGGSYKQAPFEECSKEVFEKMSDLISEVDLKEVKEEKDNTSRVETIACSGGNCEIV